MRLRRLEPVLRRALRGPCALPRATRLLVAVSGGADSTALLVALASLAREFELTLTAAHLHHGLRGDEADADLVHVRRLCERLGVPLLAARWDTRARMRREGLAGEAGLRTLRRRFLVSAARSSGAGAIATAHTADDQLETLLLRLARGTSLRGLGGMLPRHGAWLKPLLEATRFDVERDLVTARIEWREDTSNATREFARNRVRLDVVPALLAAVTPVARYGAPNAEARAGLARRVARTAGAASSGARLAAAIARAELSRRMAGAGTPSGAAAHPARPALALDARGLEKLPEAVREALLSRAWKLANPATTGLPRRHREALAAILASRKRAAEVTLPQGWRAVRTGARLELWPPAKRSRTAATSAQRARPARAVGANSTRDGRLRPLVGTPRA